MNHELKPSDLSDRILEAISGTLIDSIILDDIFSVHWLVKTRKPDVELDELIISPGGSLTHSLHMQQIYIKVHRSIGNTEIKKRKLSSSSPAPVSGPRPVVCPVCKQSVGCQRFAYHLQKCMGGGGRKSGQERRRKLNAISSTPEVVMTAAEQKESQKLNRLESDKEYFSRNPIIIRVRLSERGIPVGKQPRQIASLEVFRSEK